MNEQELLIAQIEDILDTIVDVEDDLAIALETVLMDKPESPPEMYEEVAQPLSGDEVTIFLSRVLSDLRDHVTEMRTLRLRVHPDQA